MARGKVKETETDRRFQHGFLESDERYQTDAEWHGMVLEEIEFSQENALEVLQDISKNIEYIRDHFEANPQRQVIEHKPDTPMSTWRFLFTWAMALIIFGMLALAIA